MHSFHLSSLILANPYVYFNKMLFFFLFRLCQDTYKAIGLTVIEPFLDKTKQIDGRRSGSLKQHFNSIFYVYKSSLCIFLHNVPVFGGPGK